MDQTHIQEPNPQKSQILNNLRSNVANFTSSFTDSIGLSTPVEREALERHIDDEIAKAERRRQNLRTLFWVVLALFLYILIIDKGSVGPNNLNGSNGKYPFPGGPGGPASSQMSKQEICENSDFKDHPVLAKFIDYCDETPKCNHVENFVFIKKHKCASTSLQALLQKFTHKHNLVKAHPSAASFIGGYPGFFKKEFIGSPKLKEGLKGVPGKYRVVLD